ncbi:hypothetical protein ACOZZ4_004480 [Cronobacter dublinensis]|uniref:hypothetical protein n=1 Tax=Cronobacter dublinensis TaxID=413497 RepID=UPI0013756FA3|nr:hypothetical protein [Cronobacter dublinensis]EKY3088661.1 hypothetical protein [Cronobacter dublinensis]ELQ6229790.1 hypothetical protein [Cronobacter dublinensis]ELY4005617.1 hypothetical protein [Cronobacter dublinensis]ELY4407423.1 hypothetical protein [Cronobacter dublinensis]ELY5818971.1 hypothetical protein [Cronobacter dublinensis]
MKKLTITEQKKITNDWKSHLNIYSSYKPLHLIKRNGPLLTGVYFKPMYGGEHYVPVFHTHSLMTPFPVISINCPKALQNSKNVTESISFSRHEKQLEKLVIDFKTQCPVAFEEELYFNMVMEFYDDYIHNSIEFPLQAMTDSVLLSFWCNDGMSCENKITKYSVIIDSWPENAQKRFGGVEQWEKDVRQLMNMDSLNATITSELAKFKLESLQDYKII